MKKFLIILLTLFILALAAGAIYLSYRYLDEDMYKDRFKEIVKEYTGRDLKIKGDFDIDLGWSPTVTFEDVTLSNAPWSKQKQMLRAKKVSLKLKLHSLMERDITTEKVLIEDAQILLQANKKNQKNWVPQPKKSDADKALKNLPNIELRNVTIDYQDVATNKKSQWQFKKLDIDPTSNKNLIKINLEGKYQTLPIQASIQIDRATSHKDIMNLKGKIGNTQVIASGSLEKPLQLNISLSGTDPTLFRHWLGFKLPPKSKFTLDTTVTTKNHQYKLSPLKMVVNKSELSGTLLIGMHRKTPGYSGKLNLKAKDAGQFFKDFNINDYFKGGSIRLNTQFNVRGDTTKELLQTANGQANLAILNTSYSGKGSSDMAKLLAKGQANDSLPINCAISHFNISNGVATLPALVFDAPGATVFGHGTINLATTQVDLKLEPKAKGPKLVSLAVPVQVTGSLENPSVSAKLPTKNIFAAIIGIASGAGVVGLIGAELATSIGNHPAANPCIKALQQVPVDSAQ